MGINSKKLLQKKLLTLLIFALIQENDFQGR